MSTLEEGDNEEGFESGYSQLPLDDCYGLNSPIDELAKLLLVVEGSRYLRQRPPYTKNKGIVVASGARALWQLWQRRFS